ncbi:unnamed protein product, partial [Candidula unifasciata]
LSPWTGQVRMYDFAPRQKYAITLPCCRHDSAGEDIILALSKKKTTADSNPGLPLKSRGVRFDPDLPQTLRLEFAKSNTKVIKPKPASSQPVTSNSAGFIHPITGHELRTAFFPGSPEAWAVAPSIASFAELIPAPSPGAGLPHSFLIPHHHPATLAQMHVRV